MHPTDPNARGVPATRPPELDALLHKICIDDPHHPHLATPLGINLGQSPGARWDVASNGHLILALPNGRHGLRDCGVTLIHCLAAPDRHAPLTSMLPLQRVAGGKALAEMSERAE